MKNQIDLFPELIPVKEPEIRTMIGGIYRDDNDEPDYDGCYSLSMGRNQFFCIFEGITDIEEMTEIGGAHNQKLMEGYALAVIKKDGDWLKWQIRHSGRKGHADYILAEGSCGPHFHESLKPFLRVFHK